MPTYTKYHMISERQFAFRRKADLIEKAKIEALKSLRTEEQHIDIQESPCQKQELPSSTPQQIIKRERSISPDSGRGSPVPKMVKLSMKNGPLKILPNFKESYSGKKFTRSWERKSSTI